MGKLIVGMFLGAVVALLFFLVASPALAQVATYDLFVPVAANINLAADLIVFVGKTSGTTALTTACTAGPGNFPSQTAVAVDTAGAGAARITGVLVNVEVPNGTRLFNLQDNGICTDGGITYQKTRGTV